MLILTTLQTKVRFQQTPPSFQGTKECIRLIYWGWVKGYRQESWWPYICYHGRLCWRILLPQPVSAYRIPLPWDAKGTYCSLDKFRCNGWNNRKGSNNCPHPLNSQLAQWWWCFASRPTWVHEDGSCSAWGMVVYVVCTSHCLTAMTKHRLKKGWVILAHCFRGHSLSR